MQVFGYAVPVCITLRHTWRSSCSQRVLHMHWQKVERYPAQQFARKVPQLVLVLGPEVPTEMCGPNWCIQTLCESERRVWIHVHTVL